MTDLTGTGVLTATGVATPVATLSTLSGVGTLGLATVAVTWAPAGTGTLSTAGTASLPVTEALTSEGTLTFDGTQIFTAETGLMVLDDTLTRAPTAVTVMVTNGWENQTVDFTIDGTVVYSDTLDTDGDLGPLSINVPATLTAGTHTVAVVPTGASSATGMTDTFTLAHDPYVNPRNVGPDADPVAIPAAVTSTGVYRWVLQDLMPSGLGSWVLPRNPESMSALPFERTISQEHSTALDGSFHLTDSGAEAHQFQFAGFAATQAECDNLLAYAELKRRFYLIDHRNRAWIAAGVGVELVPRKRYADDTGAFNDWGHDYTMKLLLHTSNWTTPQ